jgi:hypothetical protein
MPRANSDRESLHELSRRARRCCTPAASRPHADLALGNDDAASTSVPARPPGVAGTSTYGRRPGAVEDDRKSGNRRLWNTHRCDDVDLLTAPALKPQLLERGEGRQCRSWSAIDHGSGEALVARRRAVVQDDSSAERLPASGGELGLERGRRATLRPELPAGEDGRGVGREPGRGASGCGGHPANVRQVAGPPGRPVAGCGRRAFLCISRRRPSCDGGSGCGSVGAASIVMARGREPSSRRSKAARTADQDGTHTQRHSRKSQ